MWIENFVERSDLIKSRQLDFLIDDRPKKIDHDAIFYMLKCVI